MLLNARARVIKYIPHDLITYDLTCMHNIFVGDSVWAA